MRACCCSWAGPIATSLSKICCLPHASLLMRHCRLMTTAAMRAKRMPASTRYCSKVLQQRGAASGGSRREEAANGRAYQECMSCSC